MHQVTEGPHQEQGDSLRVIKELHEHLEELQSKRTHLARTGDVNARREADFFVASNCQMPQNQ